MKLVSVPRINALGLTGTEKTPEIILKHLSHEKINTKNDDIKKDEIKIYEYAKENINDVFYVGGDHSITYPIGCTFLEKYGKDNSFLIVFDAHPDLMPAMPEPGHEEFVKGLIDKGWAPENIVFIGVRIIEPEEQKIIDEMEIKVFTVEESSVFVNYIREKVSGKDVYLSIDIDAIDPRFAPAVNYSVEGGLSEKKFFDIYEDILKLDELRVIDLVEIVPEKDVDGKTVELGKRIVEMGRNKISQ